ncbi:cell envelope biogenesis protein OmpA [Allomuricauda sp. d1]|uniref:TolB family protein n=1 Tax=Allomuricauda sp. d1 TaxID=3136725 RepID=UPI0031CE347B
MIFSTLKKIGIPIMAISMCTALNAQSSGMLEKKEINQRVDDYLELLAQGYSETEIFQDLGNVNLLTEDYEEAAFWYEKFLQANVNAALKVAYNERYQYVLERLGKKAPANSKDWLAEISSDYENFQAQEPSNDLVLTKKTYHPMKGESTITHTPSLSVTADGRVAYFSRVSEKKPLTGIFSKKEAVHEIYRAENINGEWGNMKRVAVCPKYYSAKHPTVSSDGTRLFFASNMPGTYGDYDIYVADVKANGKFGKPKNLGPKVNTKKNDMHPSLVNGTLLFFASEGHKGYGGLDLYAVQVAENSLTQSVNLGSPINSSSDDFSIALVPEKGMGYVMSNRGNGNSLTKVAISYTKKTDAALVEKNEEGLMKVLNDESQTDFSSTVFENE